MTIAYLDFETICDKKLNIVDTYRYVFDKSFKVLCAAIAFDNEEPFIFSVTNPPLLKKGTIIVAHNAFFEQTICRKLLPDWFNNFKWEDTMAFCRYFGLPGSLKKAAESLELPVYKDEEGSAILDLTLKKSIMPTEQQLEKLKKYCSTDVKVCRLIHANIKEYFPSFEQKIWEITNRSNHKGVRVDLKLVDKCVSLSKNRITGIQNEVIEMGLPGITSIYQNKKIASFLNTKSIAEKFLLDLLKKEVSPLKKKLIKLRMEGRSTSVKKFDKIKDVQLCGRIRGLIVYHGAHTGRFTSKGAQIQNFARSSKKDSKEFMKKITTENRVDLKLNEIASLIRCSIVPNKNQKIYSADYAQIEARIAAWLSGEEWLLEDFKNNAPVYEKMASLIFDTPLEKITKDLRHLGKCAVLGCNYGMGPKRFSAEYGVDESTSAYIVNKYKNSCKKLVLFWKSLHKAFEQVLGNKNSIGEVYVGKIRVFKSASGVGIELPSGRIISYKNMRKMEATYGSNFLFDSAARGGSTSLPYWGGTFTENICQGVARDILCFAMIRLEKLEGVQLLFNVHDELVYSVDTKKLTLEKFKNTLLVPPSWAKELPINCEAFSNDRYYKE